ncbi:MAG: prephenate dehydrogenase/arogenate dehydrogenase family protein [Desulfovibrionales bacterium]
MAVPDKIAILGAKGRMGSLFVAAFRQSGIDVAALDKPLTAERLQKGLSGAGVVLLSVPITAMDEVLEAVRPYLELPTILADVCSVKVIPLRKMTQAYPGPVVGTHPLFGPEPSRGEPLRVALCPGPDSAGLDIMEALFRAAAMETFLTTAEEHDRAMAYIQALNFVTTISYFSCLPEDLQIGNFLTPSFHRRLASARKMLTEDGDLFTALFEQNPYTGDSVRGFRAFLNVAAGGDLELVREKALWWWRDQDTADEK